MPREHKRHKWHKHFLSSDHYFWNYTLDAADYNGLGVEHGASKEKKN